MLTAYSTSFLLLCLSASQVSAYPQVQARQQASSTTEAFIPVVTPYVWNESATSGWRIHASCNSTERAQLLFAFKETEKLAKHAKDHILFHGASSDFYQTYFGAAKTGEPIGWYEKILNGDKGEMLWRCDDVDDRCSDTERAGYNREESHFEEAVTCQYSYHTRMPLTQLCAFGYTVANSEDNTVYFASDIMHRIFHMPGFGENLTLDHYADGWENSTKLAKEDPSKAVRNSATLRLFALDVYAYDIAVPGIGCTGNTTISHDHASETASAPKASQTFLQWFDI
ncbi:hypothetical protein CJF32_00011141 [Rutstroemia sp. NJR-2017a WRK4]|nr:hypothetical protein CJF32_00011141 [Rutstroemia sp. NJR-2017a WRK4]